MKQSHLNRFQKFTKKLKLIIQIKLEQRQRMACKDFIILSSQSTNLYKPAQTVRILALFLDKSSSW